MLIIMTPLLMIVPYKCDDDDDDDDKDDIDDIDDNGKRPNPVHPPTRAGPPLPGVSDSIGNPVSFVVATGNQVVPIPAEPVSIEAGVVYG